jgi:CBS domain-containing protein
MPTTAHPGDDAATVRKALWNDPMRSVLVIDAANRPIGWIDERAIPRDGVISEALAVGASPLLDRRTTLKDALSMLLDADVQAGLVVDRTGALLGLVTADTIAAFMHDPGRPAREPEPPA